VERVLHDRHRVQLDEPRACLLVGLEVAVELLAEVGLPEGDVPAPADASVADVRPAEVLDHGRVVADLLARREVDVLAARPELGVDRSEEALDHGPLERAGPRERRRLALVVGVLVHVERVHVPARETLRVDRPRRQLVLRHRPHREDADEVAPFLRGRPDPHHDVVGEGAVELARIVDHRDPEVRIRMLRQVGAPDPAHALADLAVAERDEVGELVPERRLDGHGVSFQGSSRFVVARSQVRHGAKPSA
jgi:hypothetical protein